MSKISVLYDHLFDLSPVSLPARESDVPPTVAAYLRQQGRVRLYYSASTGDWWLMDAKEWRLDQPQTSQVNNA